MGLNLAGRFSKLASKIPAGLPEISATAALAGGLSVAGNTLTGQADDKGLPRVATEMLGAAGLGAIAGAGARNIRQGMSAPLNKIQAQGNFVDLPFTNTTVVVDPRLTKAGLKTIDVGSKALGAGAVTALGGLGGMIGGGLANVAGLPQTQPEPELPMAVRPALASQNVQQYLASLQGVQGAPAMMILVDA